MQQHQQSHDKRQRLFTASEVAEFEYCPLVWWHQQYEPLADADTEELFARLVELEHENGTQAPGLPEYQMVEELVVAARRSGNMRILGLAAAVVLVLAVLLIVAAILLR